MDTEIDLKSIIGLIRRQIRLILITFFAVLAVASLFTFSLTPKYDAFALVLVDTTSKNLLSAESAYSNSATDNARVESEVGIIKSNQILLKAIEENNLISDPEFGVKLGIKDRIFTILRFRDAGQTTEQQALSGVLKRFGDAVIVRRNGLTYLISITVRSEVPEKSAKLANALADIYIREQVASKVSSALVSRNTLEGRVVAAQSTIAESEKRVDGYINDSLARLEAEGASSGLVDIRNQMNQINALRQEQGEKLANLRQSIEERDFEKISSVLGTNAIAELDRQRKQIADRLASPGTSRNEAVNLRAELTKLDRNIEKSISDQTEGLKTRVDDFQKQADGLREQLRAAVLGSDLPAETLAEIYTLQQAALTARSQYQGLLARLQDLDAQTMLQLPDSRIVAPALASSNASFPPTSLIILLAGAFSIALGMGLAFLREHFVGGFVDDEQVESVLRVPLASVAPRETKAEANTTEDKSAGGTASAADLMVTAPLSRYAESIRRLRIGIDQVDKRKVNYADTDEDDVPRRGKGSVILVSSSLPGEGKTTTALALARAYALTGSRTLLIDCDLRKPSINRYLGIGASHDFIDYLRDESPNISLASLTMRDPLTSLTVLPGGRRADVATDELVMSEKMSRILGSARRHFDYIIIDSPPVEPVVDALYLAKHADVVTFVIRWGSTPQSVAKHSIRSFREHKNPNAEIVSILNQQDTNKSAAYYSYAGYYSQD